MTRREFAALAAGIPAARAGGTSVKGTDARRVVPFPLRQVRLLPGPFQKAMEANRAYLHDLEADRLLHMFRVTAGLPSSAEPMGGWERPDVEVRGHFTGHYLSACALTHAAAGDDGIKIKVEALVADLAACQKAHGNGYLSAFPPDFLARLKALQKVWAPWYTLHKIMAGLLDVHVLCSSGQALEMVEGMAGWTGRWAAGIPDDHMARILETEYGGMNEVLYNLYAVTGKEEYAALAHRFDHARVFDPLANGRDELKGLHANTTIPKIIGAARRYELTGEPRYRDIATYFWRQVTAHHCYATGGTSNHEHWRTGPGVLAAELSDRTEECCCTYNMLKLTRHLFSWTADLACADYYERALFNGILGTMNPEDGMTMYFLPLAAGYWKLFGTPRNSFWCCTGTGTESFAKLGDSIWFHDDKALYVNLFIASQLDWPEKRLHVYQETRFPDRESTALLFEVKRPTRLAVHVRVPWWATRGITLNINGRASRPRVKPGTWLTLNRTWKNRDRVEIGLPMDLHAHAMPDDETLQAVMYGPLVLAGELGAERLTREMMHGDDRGGHLLRGNPAPVPQLEAAAGDPATWLGRLPDRTLAFQTRGQRQDLTLVPLNRLFNQRYAVYWRLNGKQS